MKLFSLFHSKNQDKEETLADPQASVGVVMHRRPIAEQAGGYIPQRVNVGYYREMVLSDPTITACLEFVSLSVLAKMGEYQNSNKDIQDFIRANFEQLDGSFADLCKGLLSFLWAGFSVAEIVTTVRDNRIWLHSLPILPPETIRFHIDEDTASINYGKIDLVKQNPNQSNQATIPAEKCIIIRGSYAGELEESPYGQSRLDSIIPAYVSKQKSEKYWSQTLGRYGSPILVYTIKNGSKQIKMEDGTVKTAFELADEQVNSPGEVCGTVIEEGNSLEMIYPPSGVGQSFQEASNYYNRLIMRGLLIPSLLFDSGDVGSYSLGQEHFKLFDTGLNALLSLLTEALLEQLVRPLITWNFGEQSDYGSFEINPVAIDDNTIQTLEETISGQEVQE